MTKRSFLKKAQELYRIANASDSEDREIWTKPEMATGVCRSLDKLFQEMVEAKVITAAELETVYDTI